jgi:hypothetical protein
VLCGAFLILGPEWSNSRSIVAIRYGADGGAFLPWAVTERISLLEAMGIEPT